MHIIHLRGHKAHPQPIANITATAFSYGGSQLHGLPSAFLRRFIWQYSLSRRVYLGQSTMCEEALAAFTNTVTTQSCKLIWKAEMKDQSPLHVLYSQSLCFVLQVVSKNSGRLKKKKTTRLVLFFFFLPFFHSFPFLFPSLKRNNFFTMEVLTKHTACMAVNRAACTFSSKYLHLLGMLKHS